MHQNRFVRQRHETHDVTQIMVHHVDWCPDADDGTGRWNRSVVVFTASCGRHDDVRPLCVSKWKHIEEAKLRYMLIAPKNSFRYTPDDAIMTPSTFVGFLNVWFAVNALNCSVVEIEQNPTFHLTATINEMMAFMPFTSYVEAFTNSFVDAACMSRLTPFLMSSHRAYLLLCKAGIDDSAALRQFMFSEEVVRLYFSF